MSTRTLTLALAAMLGLCFGSDARASLPLAVSNLPNTEILFTTNSPASGSTGITFTNTTVGTGSYGFNVTSNQPADAGLIGSISGLYSYVNSAIVVNGSQQSVNVTGTGTLTINDNNGTGGNNLTGTVGGFSLSFTQGIGGVLNENAVVNLTGVTYSGSNADLKALAGLANNGIVVIDFTFIPAKSLTQLAASGGHTSWSGTITASPEPSTMALAGLGTLGLIGYGLRRRKAMGA